MKWLSLFSLLLLSTLAAAESKNYCQNLVFYTQSDFLSSLAADYHPLMCSDNILKLKERFSFKQLDNAEVVLIRHKAVPYIEIQPRKARLTFEDNTYKTPRWMFHVFLVIDGMVFDMDYTDTPQILGLSTYMKEMWDPLLLKDYVAQVISLHEYSKKDIYGSFPNQPVIRADHLFSYFSDSFCYQQTSIILTQVSK